MVPPTRQAPVGYLPDLTITPAVVAPPPLRLPVASATPQFYWGDAPGALTTPANTPNGPASPSGGSGAPGTGPTNANGGCCGY